MRIAHHESTFNEYVEAEKKRLIGRLGPNRREALRLLAAFYRALGVPWGTPFAQKRAGAAKWFTPKPRGGGPSRLHGIHVVEHLLGHDSVAVARTGFTRLLVIDLDRKDKAAVRTLWHRYSAVTSALRGAPHVLVRSSASGGLHILYFLRDEEILADELHDRVSRALVEAGVPLRPGYVEVYPAGEHKIRLPLGAGSCLIDPISKKPIATLDRAGQRKDLAASLRLLTQLAEKRRVPLRAIVGRLVRVSPPKNSAPPPKIAPSPKTAQRPGPIARGDYKARIAACEGGVSAEGMRWEEGRLMLWHFHVTQGLASDETILRYRRWLLDGKHKSKDLREDRAGTIARMLHEAPSYLEHLDRGINAGRIHQSHASFPSRAKLSLGEHILNAPLSGGSWRDRAREALTPEDHRALVAYEPWLGKPLALLLGVLRMSLRVSPDSDRLVKFPWRALERLAGKRPPPPAFRKRGKGGIVRSKYVLVMKAAQKAGWIELHEPAVARTRIAEYRIARLPGENDCAAASEATCQGVVSEKNA